MTVIEFMDRLGASQILREKAESHPKMEIKLSKAVGESNGHGHMESIVIQDRETGANEEFPPPQPPSSSSGWTPTRIS